MARSYNPRSLDEEPFLEKGERTEVNENLTWAGESESLTSIIRNLSPHWVWLAHAILLSASVLFFALSFCAKTSKISDLEYTKKYSAWCMYILLTQVHIAKC